MSTSRVTKESFGGLVGQDGILLVDCWAPWCAACRDFAPVFESAAERRSEHVFGKLDTRAEEDLAESLEISHVPTLMLYRDGILLFKQPGYVDEEGLDDILDQAENLDMGMVRADLMGQDAPCD